MRLTIKEPEINIGVDGFEGHCQLGRAETGKKLSELVEKIEDPVVIALDGSWGSGKSFFLKCWTGAHTRENGGKAKVVYFDAFQHDFLDDPLIALTGVLSDQFEPKSKAGKAIGLAKKAASKMWRPTARISLAAATAGISEMAGAVGDAAIATSSSELSKASENFWKKENSRRAAMGEFRAALEKLTEPDEEDIPQKIIIIIDELDRCRPDYALSMLEVIKHFFAVDNVIFVLGVNLKELRNSVRARYGAEADAVSYLQKFIHLRFKLPNNTKSGLSNEKAALSHYSAITKRIALPIEISELTTKYLKQLVLHNDISLRTIERIVTTLSLVPNDIKSDSPGEKIVVVGAAILKVTHPDIYASLLTRSASLSEVINALSFDTLAKDKKHQTEYISVAWLALLQPHKWEQTLKQKKEKFSGLFGHWDFEGNEDTLPNLLESHLETFEAFDDYS